ncbi:MAG: SDR family oxidoreductase [Rhodospirillaceae bacterium]|jgi:NAD(P)-dependent dehydrogenase (short-subunit alcohol dehydrogenase family)|nr:SDR family oxidoreductase [Rhodospirillaceae bacterium]MBT5665866.1 SDR family oxidoreductase [Rhodospirillaceae bacterium]MBT5811139.1 SDR family oxidoreductase [Rhodospirillaceae bacterium]
MAIPRTALVTGAARRIGRAIAIDLARHGWTVALHYNTSVEDAESARRDIESAGGKVALFQADLARESDSQRLFDAVLEQLGPIDLLVNNASLFERDDADTVTRSGWDAHMETNLRAPFVLSQRMAAALPDNASGVIVNILDQRVWNLPPGFTSYTLSKAGLWTLTRTLALALAPRIRVNAVGPGPTMPSSRQTDDQFARQQASVPLKHGATPEEVCAAVRYIADTPSMTGQMIALDGGQHLGWTHPGDGAQIEE